MEDLCECGEVLLVSLELVYRTAGLQVPVSTTRPVSYNMTSSETISVKPCSQLRG